MVSVEKSVLICLGFLAVLITPTLEAVNYNEPNLEEPRYSYSGENEGGRLTGHVQNWATLIQNYILQVTIPCTSRLFELHVEPI